MNGATDQEIDPMKAYRSRWEAVAQIEEQERRQATIGQRLQQLNRLFQLAVALRIYEKAVEHNRVGAEIARTRWVQLKGKVI